ncbi:MAG: AtpZ/AtpI family protein [Candidatus Eisenbacteria bacterium]
MPRWKKYTLAGVNPKKDLRRSKELLELSTLGLTLVFSTFIGLAIGLGLDKVLHTRPHLMIVFLVLGIVAGFVNLFRSVRRGDKDCSSKD